jgi:hypothetical protein
MISKKLIQQMNDYYGCEYIVDGSKEKAIQETVPHNDVEEANKPEEGKVYALTGGRGTRCIANGNTWKESEVKDD